MKVIKKYIVVNEKLNKINESVSLDMKIGDRDASLYSRMFDTEEQAVNWAYQEDKWDGYIILTHISFDNND